MRRLGMMMGMGLVMAGVSLPVQALPTATTAQPRAVQAGAERVTFASRDEDKTELVGYLYRPTVAVEVKAPAVVLMHGRSGLYSSQANEVYDASTVLSRLRGWARYWTSRGYVVLLVDSYGPRGFPGGLPSGSGVTLPPSVHEVTHRPLDAYGALRYLRGLAEVDGDRVGLMGFSNGGSTALATMADDKPGDMRRLGFRAAIAMGPGCGLQNRYRRQPYKAYAPVAVHMGTADTAYSPDICRNLTSAAAAAGSPVSFHAYPNATQMFDDPSRRRQSVPANVEANRLVREEAARFFETHLAPR